MDLVQDGDELYYECCKDICGGEELLVWYGSCYNLSMGVPVGLNVDDVKEEVLPDPQFTGILCTQNRQWTRVVVLCTCFLRPP